MTNDIRKDNSMLESFFMISEHRRGFENEHFVNFIGVIDDQWIQARNSLNNIMILFCGKLENII